MHLCMLKLTYAHYMGYNTYLSHATSQKVFSNLLRVPPIVCDEVDLEVRCTK